MYLLLPSSTAHAYGCGASQGFCCVGAVPCWHFPWQPQVSGCWCCSAGQCSPVAALGAGVQTVTAPLPLLSSSSAVGRQNSSCTDSPVLCLQHTGAAVAWCAEVHAIVQLAGGCRTSPTVDASWCREAAASTGQMHGPAGRGHAGAVTGSQVLGSRRAYSLLCVYAALICICCGILQWRPY